jgi:hypothetical protein
MATMDFGMTVIGVLNLEVKVSQFNSGLSPVYDISDLHLQSTIAKGMRKAITGSK